MAILDQPLRTLVGADAAETRLTPLAESVIARVASMAYDLVREASPAAIMTAASSGSNAALVGALADLVGAESNARRPDAIARLRGQVALATCVAESGGVWGADDATAKLHVTRSTLQNWRTTRRVVALERDDASFAYPVAQFEPARSDLTSPRPYAAMARIGEIVGDSLSPEELVALLATPQEALGNSSGGGVSRTPFQALADGDAEAVLALITHAVARSDADAPSVRDTDVGIGALRGIGVRNDRTPDSHTPDLDAHEQTGI
jgi:hypothetical protein